MHPVTTDQDLRTFCYQGFELDRAGTRLSCHYAEGDRRFVEHFELDVPPAARAGAATAEDVVAAARLVHLLAGVSYYKTSAPPFVDVGETSSEEERGFLRHFYLEGLGEFAYRNGLDLSGLEIRSAPGERAGQRPGRGEAGETTRSPDRAPLPLVPFGGGIDSIVTVEEVRRRAPDTALLVVSHGGRRFAAIEEPAAATGLPVVRVDRHLDPQVLKSRELGFFNGHVPVTGIYSAVATWAAAVAGRNLVVMSNEWSASAGNIVVSGRAINHQYSKSLDFEERFRDQLAETVGSVKYFSYLRARSELWVAQRFARIPAFHPLFRSCNRAFHVDPDARLTEWCGQCDKCCFIDLVLAPFVPARRLAAIFGGAEPLDDPGLLERFRTLIAASGSTKPWECVGEPGECRAAAVLAADRPDRAGSMSLRQLAAESARLLDQDPRSYLEPMGVDHVPDVLQAQDLLV